MTLQPYGNAGKLVHAVFTMKYFNFIQSLNEFVEIDFTPAAYTKTKFEQYVNDSPSIFEQLSEI